MTEYNFTFSENSPINVDEIYTRKINNSNVNSRARQRVSDKIEIEKILEKFFKLYEIHYIENANPSWNTEFDVRTVSPFHGVPNELLAIEKKNAIPNYSIHFRSTIRILRWIFPDINLHLKDIGEKKIPNDIFDYIKNVTLTRTFSVKHNMLNTIDCEQIYWIQALYRACIWHNQFSSGRETRWNLPVCMFAYRHDDKNFLNIHPGNTRTMFYDFKDIQFDSMMIVPKKDKKHFPKLDKFNYVSTKRKFKKLLKTHDIEYIIDEVTGYAELFFVLKEEYDINAQTVLFFGKGKKRDKFIKFCRDLKAQQNRQGKHPKDHNSKYDITLTLDKGNIFVQDEHIAYLDDDGHLRFNTMRPKYFLNF